MYMYVYIYIILYTFNSQGQKKEYINLCLFGSLICFRFSFFGMGLKF